MWKLFGFKKLRLVGYDLDEYNDRFWYLDAGDQLDVTVLEDDLNKIDKKIVKRGYLWVK
jgi:hypothetical protein|tara:strand:- start:2524 stop:2700 length:177 start_codon:yes stop_codon:yes gene_type:complete